MSEYQYYEFQAVDRPLSEKEMRELRPFSTRARITPTSFVNEYNWGDFKGDPDAWMEKYFDAFLYLANWGTHILKLRLPSRLLDLKTVREYCSGDSFSVREKSGKIILTFESDDEEGDDFIEGEGALSSLFSVRAELACGDLRTLYLAWLLCVQNRELDDEEQEPPVPPGLGQLSASLESLAEFLRIDRDLFQVAVQSSPQMEKMEFSRKEVMAWVTSLPSQEKDELITDMIVADDHSIVSSPLQRFIRERSTSPISEPPPRRTVGDLLAAAEVYSEERRRLEAEKRAPEKTRREREVALAREKYLDKLVGQQSKLWAEVERLIASKQPKSYDLAVKVLLDLRDLGLRAPGGDFHVRLAALRQAHARKPSFLERLDKAGL